MIAEAGTIPSDKKRLRGAEWLWWITLLAMVTLLWCSAYNRWTREAWRTPISYGGDAIAEMAWVKLLATGEMMPIVPKTPASLGAPFVANWNDYPTMEEGIFVWWAVFVRACGLFPGANLVLLSAHLLAAASFYFVCRTLRYHRAWSIMGALLFSMSYFAFMRNLEHLVITFYWHVPLGLLVAWWCVSGAVTVPSRKLWFCIAVAVLHGIQNPYYTGIFLQFLALAALVCLVRRDNWRVIALPLLLIGVVLAAFVLMNVDTLYSRLSMGPNNLTLTREYAGVEKYALRPVELILPYVHRFAALQNWTNRVYYLQTMFQGEKGAPYLGIVGIVALAGLIWVSFSALVRRELRGIPMHFGGVGWVLAFSVVGGLNGLLALFGLVLFRGSNRYSIVILALVLLFLVRELSRLTRRWHWFPIAASATLILLLGLWDQIPFPPSKREIHDVHEEVASDARLVSKMESRLPSRAMVFQLPVCDYPEVPSVLGMMDYEHFRPYLHSRALRFSYGSQKGRTRERWQAEALQFGLPRFVQTLESYGFSAVLINKKAYGDRAASLVSGLQSAGRSEVLAESNDLVGILLQPVAQPRLPPEFDQKWRKLEGTEAESWRWGQGDAKLILYNPGRHPKTVRLAFSLDSIEPLRLDIYVRRVRLYGTYINRARPMDPVEIAVSLRPGRNELTFQPGRAVASPGKTDPRKVPFSIRNFELKD